MLQSTADAPRLLLTFVMLAMRDIQEFEAGRCHGFMETDEAHSVEQRMTEDNVCMATNLKAF